MVEPKVLVVGNTEVGATIASKLLHLGIGVFFVGRKNRLNTTYNVETSGSVLATLKLCTLSDVPFSAVSMAFFCDRATDLRGVVERYMPYLQKPIPVVAFCPMSLVDPLRLLVTRSGHLKWRVGYVTFDTALISDVIYKCQRPGYAAWGPMQKGGGPELSAIEMQLHQLDSFFHPQTSVLQELRRRWLVDLVVGSLGFVTEEPRVVRLLDDLARLKPIAFEGYRLGEELFGRWDHSFDQMYSQLVSYLSSDPVRENPWVRHHRSKKKSDNHFYAKLAKGRQNFDLLSALSDEIESREQSAKQ